MKIKLYKRMLRLEGAIARIEEKLDKLIPTELENPESKKQQRSS